MKTRNSIIGLIISAIIAATSYFVDQQKYVFFRITDKFSVMNIVFVLALCAGIYYILLLMTKFRIHSRQGTLNEVKMLSSLYKMLAGIGVMIGIAWALGQLSAFGAFFSLFGGMLLGWSLQAPVSGFAAWIMITITRPYKIGDRVQFPNHALMGDVVKFSPMYLTLNQVGGTIGSEESIGRMINVPNSLLFSAMVINCTYMQKKEATAYILDEALFRITLDSDWDTVEEILLDTAREVTKDIIEKTGSEPYVRADTWDYGTLFRLRYMTDSTDRPRIMYEIVKMSTKKIQQNKNIDLAIPYVYSFKRGFEGAGSSNTKPSETIEQIDIEKIYCEKFQDANFYEENKSEILELVKSIEEDGLLQPIGVSRNLTDDNYTLLYGEKRLKACMILGWAKIPALVKNKIGTDIIKSKPLGADVTYTDEI